MRGRGVEVSKTLFYIIGNFTKKVKNILNIQKETNILNIYI